MRQKFIESNQEIQETKVSELGYVIEYCDETGEFVLKIGEKAIYSAVEGNVSIINLFKSMGINCALKAVDKIENISFWSKVPLFQGNEDLWKRIVKNNVPTKIDEKTGKLVYQSSEISSVNLENGIKCDIYVR